MMLGLSRGDGKWHVWVMVVFGRKGLPALDGATKR